MQVNGRARIGLGWLPNMDLNHDKQIQSLLCYRYTIRHSKPAQIIRFQNPVKPAQCDRGRLGTGYWVLGIADCLKSPVPSSQYPVPSLPGPRASVGYLKGIGDPRSALSLN